MKPPGFRLFPAPPGRPREGAPEFAHHPDRRLVATRALAALAALAIVVAGCQKEQAPPPPPATVVVMDITTTNLPMSTEFIGQLDSPQNVEIRARVEGFVDQMLFVEGTNVNVGAHLFKLDDKPYKERLAAAKGMLGEAEAALKKYEADVARLQPLADLKAVPKQDLDNALASVDVGKAAVVSAKARVEASQLDIDYCDIRSPIAGLIGAKQVSIGELVGKGQPTLMATISTLDPIWFNCNVGEVQYLRAQAETRRTGKQIEDMPVTLILSDGTEHPAKGRFIFIDRAVDPKTGTIRVRALFRNPDLRPGDMLSKALRPGMFGRIRVDLGTRADSILVPEKAVTELQGNNFVWVVGADNKASQRPVVVGQQAGGSLLIQEGLKAGERVIVEGLQKARQDQAVQPITLVQAAEAAAAEAAKQAEARKEKEARKAEAKPAKH